MSSEIKKKGSKEIMVIRESDPLSLHRLLEEMSESEKEKLFFSGISVERLAKEGNKNPESIRADEIEMIAIP